MTRCSVACSARSAYHGDAPPVLRPNDFSQFFTMKYSTCTRRSGPAYRVDWVSLRVTIITNEMKNVANRLDIFVGAKAGLCDTTIERKVLNG